MAQDALVKAKKELEWARACPPDRGELEVQVAEAKVREASECLAGLEPMGARLRSARDRTDALNTKAAELRSKADKAEEEAKR